MTMMNESGVRNLPAWTVRIAALVNDNPAEAEDAYAALAQTMPAGETAACRMLTTALVGRAGLPHASIDPLAAFALQRCGEVGIDPAHVIAETVAFAATLHGADTRPVLSDTARAWHRNRLAHANDK